MFLINGMLCLVDLIYTAYRKRKVSDIIESGPKIINGVNNDEVSFYFVPKIVSRSSLGNGIIKKGENAVIYTLPSRELIHENPEETVKNLYGIYNPAIDLMDQYVSEGYKINLIGVSTGNVIAIKAGAELPNGKLKRFDSITGGLNVGLSAWKGILTRDIVRRVCKSAEEYEEGVKVFSPAQYVSKIKAEEIFLRIGSCDLLIPFSEGRLLMEGLKDKADKTDFRTYIGADHGAAIYLASRELGRKYKV